MEHRGQSALEYLMTYGWALVVIVIAVAALVILLNPSQIQGNRCDTKLGPFALSAESSVLTNKATFVLTNGLGVSINYMDFELSGTDNGAAETWFPFDTAGTCNDATLAPNVTGNYTCNFTAGNTIGSGDQYDMTVKLRYATPNVGQAAVADRPVVTAKCTGKVV
ncbi:MAG: hypothetical protein J4203_02820 [Candidatus Diapherotrites archaeon]|nr:hypothetical protein [Candidatus Diapherotrites archaeon]